MAAKLFFRCCNATSKNGKALHKGASPASAGLSRRLPALSWVVLMACAPVLAEPSDSHPSADLHKPATANRQEPDRPAPDRTEDARRAVDRIFDDPLGGVVVNRTVTVLGKDFYQYFSTRWRQIPQSSHYTISVHERPTARFGSEVWVQYRQQRMFHTFLPPARSATRSIAEVAVQHVLENISRRELERLATRNPDLGPEEL